jgi:hypothetical protein
LVLYQLPCLSRLNLLFRLLMHRHTYARYRSHSICNTYNNLCTITCTGFHRIAAV